MKQKRFPLPPIQTATWRLYRSLKLLPLQKWNKTLLPVTIMSVPSSKTLYVTVMCNVKCVLLQKEAAGLNWYSLSFTWLTSGCAHWHIHTAHWWTRMHSAHPRTCVRLYIYSQPAVAKIDAVNNLYSGLLQVCKSFRETFSEIAREGCIHQRHFSYFSKCMTWNIWKIEWVKALIRPCSQGWANLQ